LTPVKATQQARREAKQVFRLCLVKGALDEQRARKAVQQIVALKPRGYLATLLWFRRLVELDVARRTAKVESALALPREVQASVQQVLTRVYGPVLATSFEGNPALIGGMRIRVGSDVFDGSVRGRLADLERRF
jgi:F-type H+-transporting ATPase subunit delta